MRLEMSLDTEQMWQMPRKQHMHWKGAAQITDCTSVLLQSQTSFFARIAPQKRHIFRNVPSPLKKNIWYPQKTNRYRQDPGKRRKPRHDPETKVHDIFESWNQCKLHYTPKPINAILTCTITWHKLIRVQEHMCESHKLTFSDVRAICSCPHVRMVSLT